mmetsp:Transcript_61920/g.55873  ORF Transcript_61920/g.55873 Transcript_61920/m.55873 type:complete len:177 (+) Transcript_61920:99-629(+)
MNKITNLVLIFVLLLIYVLIGNVAADGPWTFTLSLGALTNHIDEDIDGLYYKLKCYQDEDVTEYISTEKGWVNNDKRDRADKFDIKEVDESGSQIFPSWWISPGRSFYWCDLYLMESKSFISDTTWAEHLLTLNTAEGSSATEFSHMFLHEPGNPTNSRFDVEYNLMATEVVEEED